MVAYCIEQVKKLAVVLLLQASQKLSSHFTYFKQVKKLVAILAALKKSKT